MPREAPGPATSEAPRYPGARGTPREVPDPATSQGPSDPGARGANGNIETAGSEINNYSESRALSATAEFRASTSATGAEVLETEFRSERKGALPRKGPDSAALQGPSGPRARGSENNIATEGHDVKAGDQRETLREAPGPATSEAPKDPGARSVDVDIETTRPGINNYSESRTLSETATFPAATPASRARLREIEFMQRRAAERREKAAVQADEAEKTFQEARAARTSARTRVSALTAQQLEIEKNLTRHRLFLDTSRSAADSEAVLAHAMDGELRDSVRQMTDRVLDQQPGRLMGFDSVPSAGGRLDQRALDFVPDEEIEAFLESDIEHLARVYKHSVAPDVELAARFGRADMQPQLDAIRDDYARLRAALPEKGRAIALRKLAKQEADDIRDIQAMRDIIRGTYKLPDNPAGFAARTVRVMKQANYLRLMGGMTLSSIPDIGRPVMVHGVERTMMHGIRPLVQNWRGVKLMAREARLAGVGLDMVLDNRTLQLTDIFDDYGRLSRFERGMSWMTTRMGLANLMTPWNASLKQFSAIIAQSRMLKAIIDPASRTRPESEWLAMLGIDDEMAGRIAKQFARHGETQVGGVMWANTDAWANREAAEAFRAALLKSVESTIVTPGAGDRPLWMSTNLGSLLGQFRAFSFAATQQVALAGLQQRDAAMLNGLLLSIGLGMLSYALKVDQEKRSDDPGRWILEGVDRAGVLGILSDATQIGTRMAGLDLGGSRYAGREDWEVFGGPSVGLLKDAGMTIVAAGQAALAGDGFSESEISAARRLVPFQNLFYLRRLFDAAEAGIASSGYGAMQRTVPSAINSMAA
jgi:hypothetical protein